jgi:hypothetical protein
MVEPPLHALLRQPGLDQLQQIHRADLVIGLPTHNTQPELVTHLAQQIALGCTQYFPHLKTVLLNTDVGLSGVVRQALQRVNLPGLLVISTRYDGVAGRGTAISAILHAALTLRAKAIILLDSETRNLAPTWIPALATLILNQQADLVKPRYEVALADSACNDLLYYPFTRAVWGVNLQMPGAKDFALSGRLIRKILRQDVWETDVIHDGFDIWLSTFVNLNNWRIAQTALGRKEITAAHAPALTMPDSFREGVGTMFHQLQARYRRWPKIKRVSPLSTLTEFAPSAAKITMPDYDPAAALEALVLGWMNHRSLWQQMLLPANLSTIEALASQPADQFYFPADLWAKVVYDVAVAYNKAERDPEAIIAAFYPLYLGRLAGFWPEIAGLTAIGRAGAVSAQGVEFEEQRPYLLKRWKTFSP